MTNSTLYALGMSEEQLREAVRRLCHFAPTGQTENLVPALHDFLVQHAMADLGTNSHSLLDLKTSLHKLFDMEFEEEEIKDAVSRLVNAKVVWLPSLDTYALDIKRYEELTASIEGSRSFEQRIVNDWLRHVREKHIGLTEEDLQALGEDLKIYTTKVFARHGAECVALVYSGREEADRFVEQLEDDVFGSLPRRSALVNHTRLIELPAFFKDAPPDRKRYIAELLDSTFTLHMLHIDERCSALVQSQFQGHRLYLDTNFIYRVLGLDGPMLLRAAERLVEISQQLGYTLLVSTRTVKEMRSSLEKARKLLKENPLPPTELAALGAKYTTEEDFITAYWREYAKTGISIDDFFGIYQHFEDLLKEHKIKVDEKIQTLCKKIGASSELKDQISKLNLATIDHPKHPAVAEHDAFHRLLIKRLRGREPSCYSETKVWFLTCDTQLPVFDRYARREPSEIPFCILADQWIQIIRPLLPRTPDFDEAFAALLTSPYLRSYGSLPPEFAQKILGRIALFHQYSPELAVKVLTNRHLTEGLRKTEDEDKQFELIDNAMAEAAEEFRIERDQIQAQLQKTSGNLESLREERNGLGKQLEEEQVKRKALEEEISADGEKTKRKLEQIESELDTERRKRTQLEKQLGWTWAILIWTVIGVISVWLVPWGELTSLSRFIVISAIVLVSLGGLSFPLDKNKVWKVLGGIGVIASILSFLWNIAK